MGGTCGTSAGEKKCTQLFWQENLQERSYLKNLDIETKWRNVNSINPVYKREKNRLFLMRGFYRLAEKL